MRISHVLTLLAVASMSIAAPGNPNLMDCKKDAAPDCAAQCFAAYAFKDLFKDVRRTGIRLLGTLSKADKPGSSKHRSRNERRHLTRRTPHAFESTHGLMGKHYAIKKDGKMHYYRDGDAKASYAGIQNDVFKDSRSFNGATSKARILKEMASDRLKMVYTPEQCHAYERPVGTRVEPKVNQFIEEKEDDNSDDTQTIEEQPPQSSSQGALYAIITVADFKAQRIQGHSTNPDSEGNSYIEMENWQHIEACIELAEREKHTEDKRKEIIKAHRDFAMLDPISNKVEFVGDMHVDAVNKYFEEAHWKQGHVVFAPSKVEHHGAKHELTAAEVAALPAWEKERLDKTFEATMKKMQEQVEEHKKKEKEKGKDGNDKKRPAPGHRTGSGNSIDGEAPAHKGPRPGRD